MASSGKSEIISHPFSIKVEDNFQGEGKLNIHFWTFDKDSNPNLIRITDFPAFCNVELPE